MTDGLKDAHREAIIATIAANEHVERAVLFGSRATGTNTVSSDVDIALFGNGLTLTDQARLAAALDEIPMAQSVDLLLYHAIRDRTLREHIRRQGIEWYMRASGAESHDTGSESGSGWPVVKLEEVSSKEPGSITIGPFGSRMKSDVYTASGVPVIRGTNISNNRAWRNEWVYVSDEFADGVPNCNVREGDLVFPHRGSIGEVAIIPGDRARYMLSTSLMKFRPDREKVSPLFLFYYFRSAAGRAEIMRYSSQVGTPGIGQPLTSLRQFRVPIPPREEQERIAGTLSSLDDKIELNRRMNATLEAMTRALFRSWFVDFDPVRAKMAGRDTGLPPEIADVFPDRLVDSALGDIPQGWTVGTLGEIAGSPRNGIDPGQVPDDTPYIGLEHMPRRSVALTDWGRTGSVSSTKTAFENGDMLFGKLRPYFHKVGIAPVNGVCSTDIVVLKARMPEWSAFVLACISSSEFVSYASRVSTGTKMPRTSWRTMSRYEMCQPAPPVTAAFQDVVSPMLERILANVHESRTVGRLRDSMLPMLVSGELRVIERKRSDLPDGHQPPLGANAV